ncbi:hypothetical protein DPMN_099126 [Dreissena polymorpha]|uniref:Uncharacterized protein n=1 Tax=Dreissena polymorpha TaxID=45954 RepID=A0A9D4LEC3_DREPO|nr:hypothetical protein DPMN_099126 [Dreissena polymorpha]
MQGNYFADTQQTPSVSMSLSKVDSDPESSGRGRLGFADILDADGLACMKTRHFLL